MTLYDASREEQVNCEALAVEIMAGIEGFDDLWKERTPEEQEEIIRLFLRGLNRIPTRE